MNLQTIMERIKALEARIAALEKAAAEAQAKRGPGRPPKEESNG